jgi:peptidoglycan hydrolase CwlO-like protein
LDLLPHWPFVHAALGAFILMAPRKRRSKSGGTKMDHLEECKQIQESLEQIAAEVVRLSEQIQRIQKQLSNMTAGVDSEQRMLC